MLYQVKQARHRKKKKLHDVISVCDVTCKCDVICMGDITCMWSEKVKYSEAKSEMVATSGREAGREHVGQVQSGSYVA